MKEIDFENENEKHKKGQPEWLAFFIFQEIELVVRPVGT